MGKERTYYFLVDKLNRNTAPVLRSALETIPEILAINIRVREGVIEVAASKDIEEKIKMTCSVAGTPFRTQVRKRDL